MKTGRTIEQLASEIQRQMDAKKDYVTPRALMQLELRDRVRDGAIAGAPVAGNGGVEPVLVLKNGNGGKQLGLRELAHDQLAARLAIPRNYYDRMRVAAPALLVGNVNHWLQHGDGDKAMLVRTIDGDARAFLSDRYRPLDNADLAEAMLPALMRADLDVMSCEITEKRLYIKAVDKRIHRDVPVGKKMGDASHTFFDTMSPAIVISNSEVGCGALSIETGVWTKVCTNLAIASERSMRKYHVGGRWGAAQEGFYELLSNKTKALSDAALWAQARDLIAAALDAVKFDAYVAQIQATTEQRIVGDVPQVVEVTAKFFGMSDGERGGVLKHLIEGGDLSRYGLFNAITRTAEDLPDYDRATQFERFGGEVIELERNQWRRIAEAEPVAA